MKISDQDSQPLFSQDIKLIQLKTVNLDNTGVRSNELSQLRETPYYHYPIANSTYQEEINFQKILFTLDPASDEPRD